MNKEEFVRIVFFLLVFAVGLMSALLQVWGMYLLSVVGCILCLWESKVYLNGLKAKE